MMSENCPPVNRTAQKTAQNSAPCDESSLERTYLCIDLKSFYASVECVERGLDPLTTDLVVADPTRSEATICLAVSPSLRQKGVKNRCRVFQIPKNFKYIMAPPRMQKYIDYATRIYGIYLSYFSKDDIHVYSIDEAFIDVTDYLKMYHKTAREMALFLMDEIWNKIGVRATAGVGSNLYLAKVAMDIIAKKSPDFIAELDEKSYQEQLWDHRPLTDFWRIGVGMAKRLENRRMFTMRDIAHADEDVLYDIFGKDAELLIDHAWGREPVRMCDIKNYRSKEKSFSSGQVLPRDYTAGETALVVREMMRDLCLRLTESKCLASSVTLSLGPAAKSLEENSIKRDTKSHKNPGHARGVGSFIGGQSGYLHGTYRFLTPTSSIPVATDSIDELFSRIVDKNLKYRRIYLNCNHIIPTTEVHQASLFDTLEKTPDAAKIQSAILNIKNRYGKNAILCGEDLEEAATTRERNNQIGGHRRG